MGSFPGALYVNAITQIVYVSNAGSGTVSMIDSLTNKEMPDIKVGGSPLATYFNPDTRILYVVDIASPKIYEISDNKLLVGINFNIKPSSAGNIECNKMKISNNNYVRVTSGTSLSCRAITNSGFLFSSWTSNFSSNSNNTETTFKASDFGNITA